MKKSMIRKCMVAIVGLALMALFTACAGVGGNGNSLILTGSITSVNSGNHSVTLNVNGQPYTINGLSDQEVKDLQAQQGHTYTIQVTQNSDGSYTISSNTTPTPGTNENQTPEGNPTGVVNEPGTISFNGPVQSVNSSSIVVKMPDGTTLSMLTNAQTESDFTSTQPTIGQMVKVDATAQSNGSFVATKLKTADSSDNTGKIDYQGVTTQPVGADHVIHFSVGNRNFSYTIGAATELKDFNGNATSIASGATVKVEVQFNGASSTVLKISSANS